MSTRTKICEHCKSKIPYHATVCPRCTRDLTWRSDLNDDVGRGFGKALGILFVIFFAIIVMFGK